MPRALPQALSLPQQQAAVVDDVKHKPDWPLSTTFAHTRPVFPRSACSCPFAQGGGITGGGEGVAAHRCCLVGDQTSKYQSKGKLPSQKSNIQDSPHSDEHLQKLRGKARWRVAPVPQQQEVTPFVVVEAQRPATLLMTTFAHTRLAALSSAGSASVWPVWQTAPVSSGQPTLSALRMTGQQFAEQHCTGKCLSQLAMRSPGSRQFSTP